MQKSKTAENGIFVVTPRERVKGALSYRVDNPWGLVDKPLQDILKSRL